MTNCLFSGVRISKTGRRFVINDVIIWNLYDSGPEIAAGFDPNTTPLNKRGQAALFLLRDVEYLD